MAHGERIAYSIVDQKLVELTMVCAKRAKELF
jgi:hypothetical protein